MASRHRSARRRRVDRGRAARLAIPFAIPVVLALVVGAIIVVNDDGGGGGGSLAPTAQQSPLGATANPTDAGAAAAPAATGSAPIITDAANVNCDIIVPANALSAQGLATPYLLTGPAGMTPAQSGCEMSNAAALGAFVQATILDPATGKLSVYNPLVITQGTTPAVAPSVPNLPADAIVTIDFGFNGTDLFQVGATPTALKQANCLNGQTGSIFGQVSFCNGVNFFNAAFQDEREGKLKVPSAGTSSSMVVTDGAMGTGNDVPGHPQLRDGRPGPVRQRDHRVPAQPGDRPDRAGHRVQRGQPAGRHAAAQRQRQHAARPVHRPGPRLHPATWRQTWPTTTCRPPPRRLTSCSPTPTSRRTRP